MSHLISRRTFAAGLALSIPTSLAGMRATAQSFVHDPNGTAMDLESAFLRISPHLVRDMLMSTSFDDHVTQRWADISDSPYFSSVGGVNVLLAGADDVVIGAYGIYLAPAGARAGQYLGRRALEASTTEIVTTEVAGYAGEVLVYGDGASELTQVPVGNVMVLGYDASGSTAATATATTTTSEQANASGHPSMANASILIEHLRQMFEISR